MHAVTLSQPSIFHGCQDTVPQRLWGPDVYLLVSRDVIGLVTIGLAIRGSLLVFNLNPLPRTVFDILSLKDIEAMTLTFSRDVIGHMTNGGATYGFH